MPNNTRTRPDVTWVDGYTPPSADWEDLERKIFRSWNGDRGGAYSPTGTVTFAGAGLQLPNDTRLTAGGAIRGPNTVFKIKDGTWPQLASSHRNSARKIVQPIFNYFSTAPHLWSKNHPFAGVGSVALAAKMVNAPRLEIPDLYVPLRVVDGAVLTELEVHFRVAQRRLYPPLGMPKVRIVRVPLDPANEAPEPLRATEDGTGFWSPEIVTTADAWYAGGAGQTMTYVCDKNHTIDVSKYSYMVHIIEEVGALSLADSYDGIRLVERKPDCMFAALTADQDFTGLDNAAVEGGVAYAGIRMLMVDSDARNEVGYTDTVSTNNGIWEQQAADWNRAADLKTSAHFSPFWIVRVANGRINGGTIWQCQYPTSSNAVDLESAAKETRTQIAITPATPRGNIYHSLVPTFAVGDLRFQ